MTREIFGAAFLFLATLACGLNPPTTTTPSEQPGINTVVAATIEGLTRNAPTNTAQVSATQTPAATQASGQLTPDGNLVNTNEVTFLIPNGIANDATSVTTTGVEYPYINPSNGDMPAHVKLTLNLYALNGTAFQPQMMIYHSAEYAQYSDLTAGIITTMQSVQYTDGQPLPDNLKGAMFTAQVHAINFQNGHGIRLLTQVGQGPLPINNHDMFYYFQGITNDGQYYIQAIMPANVPFLPADYDMNSPLPAGGIPFNTDDITGYFNSVEQKLNATDTFSFTPYLDHLDAMIESIQVKGF